MNERPPNEHDDVEEQYRRASARDASRPSESVRRAILRHAAELAAQRAAQGGPVQSAPDRNALGAVGTMEAGPVKPDFEQPAANEARWRRAAYGGLAAAALAGVLVAPHFLPTAAHPPLSSSPAVPTTPEKKEAAPTASAPAAPVPGASTAAASAPLARAPASQARTVPPSAARAARSDVSAETSDASSAGLRAAPSSTAVSALAAVRTHAPIDSAAALRQAAQSGDTRRLEALLDEQIDLDARDSAGRTALMLAVIGAQAQAVDALLARGADPNAADSSGTTPLAAALAAKHADIIAALRRAGAH